MPRLSPRPARASNGYAGIWFTIVQTSVASGLAWYIAHDVLGHPQPFFAPIASAVSLSISNVYARSAPCNDDRRDPGDRDGYPGHCAARARGVSIGVAALIALCAAVFIGHGSSARA